MQALTGTFLQGQSLSTPLEIKPVGQSKGGTWCIGAHGPAKFFMFRRGLNSPSRAMRATA
jgi:hypothetical protein